MLRKNVITVENTRFIFATNFSGNPENDRFGDDRRKANLVIPDPRQADELTRLGFKVRSTNPREDDADYEPEYFVTVLLNYQTKYPPRVFLVSGENEPRPLDEDSVGLIDSIPVSNVNVVLNPYDYSEKLGREGKSLYVRTMYVEQDLDDDPYAARYRGRYQDDALPFSE